MRTVTASMLIVSFMVFGWVVGCQEKKEEPVAQAPAQEPPMESFPESQVPAPEVQPPAAPQVSPPVDTSGPIEAQAAPKAAGQKPKESYAKSEKTSSRTYTVRKGDTLQKIAQKYYGTTAKWRRIYDANKKAIGKDPNKLSVGTKLVIP